MLQVSSANQSQSQPTVRPVISRTSGSVTETLYGKATASMGSPESLPATGRATGRGTSRSTSNILGVRAPPQPELIR